MKRLFTSKLYLCFILLSAFAITSCTKMPGHDVTPGSIKNGGGNPGGGTTSGTSAGTITFKIGNGSLQTWTSGSTYLMGLVTTPTTGPYAVSSTPGTLVTAGPTDVSQIATTGVGISFNGITPGTYPAALAGCYIRTQGVALTGTGGTVMITVTEENITIISTSLGTVKGTIKGTFAGDMLDMTTYARVSVSGTFEVQL